MSALEILDTVIIAVGLTSVLTAFVLKPAMVGLDGSAWQVFISILYPVGDIVLLSPACASFDQFSDYVARAEAFVAEVQELGMQFEGVHA